MRRVLTQAQVAAGLGVTEDWFYRNRARLMREEGFPPPLPLGIAGMKWDPLAIELWMNSKLPPDLRAMLAPPAPPAAPGPLSFDDEAAIDAALDARAAAIAAGEARGKAA